MDASAGAKGQLGTAHPYARGHEVTPDRDASSYSNPAPKRARRRLETDNDDGSDDADGTQAYDWGTSHSGGTRQGESPASTAQLLSESIIELLHVCTLIQVELNNNNSDQVDEYQRIKHEEGSDPSSHAQDSRKSS